MRIEDGHITSHSNNFHNFRQQDLIKCKVEFDQYIPILGQFPTHQQVENYPQDDQGYEQDAGSLVLE